MQNFSCEFIVEKKLKKKKLTLEKNSKPKNYNKKKHMMIVDLEKDAFTLIICIVGASKGLHFCIMLHCKNVFSLQINIGN